MTDTTTAPATGARLNRRHFIGASAATASGGNA